MVRSEYGSLQLNQSSFNQEGLNLFQDTERASGPNLPNVTSPGRLMIGPKVSTNEVMLGPQQRSQKARQELRKEQASFHNNGSVKSEV